MTAAAHITGFDDVVIGIMIFSCIFAFFRGLVREILSLIAWIGAGVITIHYYPSVAANLHANFKNPVAADIMAIAGIYIAALMGFAIINMVIVKSIKGGEGSGMLDNLLGLGFGALRGALILSLGFFLLSIALPKSEYPDWLKQSVTRPYLEKGATLLAQAAPQTLRDISLLQQRAIEKAQSSSTPAADNAMAPGGASTEGPPMDNFGYSNNNAQQLDRMMNNTRQQP